jgi:GNAT superfamily N-acetyltransferase
MLSDSASFRITATPEDVSPSALADLYASVGFGSRDAYEEVEDDLMRVLFPAGVYGFFAWAQQDLIGMARSFSDDSMCTWLAEVCVQPAFQRQGIGGMLVEAVIQRFGHTAIYLETFREHESFFRRNGIASKPKLVACSRAAAVRPR